MKRLATACVTRCEPRIQTPAIGVAVAAFLGLTTIGCVGATTNTIQGSAPEASYDHYFYDDASADEAANVIKIQQTIERLAGPAWEEAKADLIDMGQTAIYEVIKHLDRTDSTYVSVRTMPGHAVPETSETWTLGQVAYSVLVEFVGGFSDYTGPIPGPQRTEWEAWWEKNRKLVVRSRMRTAPPHVYEQKLAARAALLSIYEQDELKRAESERLRTQRTRSKEELKRQKVEAKRRARQKKEAPKAKEKPVKKEKAEKAPPVVEEVVEETPAESTPAPAEEEDDSAPRRRRRRR